MNLEPKDKKGRVSIIFRVSWGKRARNLLISKKGPQVHFE